MANYLTRPMRAYERPRPVDMEAQAAATPTPPPRRLLLAAPLGGESPPDGTTVSRAHAQMQQAADDFADAVDEINPGNFTPEGLRDVVVQAEIVPAASIHRAVGSVENVARSADERVQNIREGLSPQRDLTGEMRAQAMWARISRVLDATDDGTVSGVARELISEASPDQLAVLAAELPWYLRARRIAVDWLPAALAQAHPPLREATERAVQAAKARDVVAANGRALHKAMAAARQTGRFRPPRLVSPLAHDPDA